MTGRFEAHITMDKEHGLAVEEFAYGTDWVYSQITGCPILGQGTYCYLTGYDKDAGVLLSRMAMIAERLRSRGIEPLRMKIENIVYDTKTNVNEIGT